MPIRRRGDSVVHPSLPPFHSFALNLIKFTDIGIIVAQIVCDSWTFHFQMIECNRYFSFCVSLLCWFSNPFVIDYYLLLWWSAFRMYIYQRFLWSLRWGKWLWWWWCILWIGNWCYWTYILFIWFPSDNVLIMSYIDPFSVLHSEQNFFKSTPSIFLVQYIV